MAWIKDLESRNLIQNSTPGVRELLEQGPCSAYIGFDPTATSLHIGSLVQIILLKRFQDQGHRPYILLGGATGMIGDPSGKSQERNLLDLDQLEANLQGVKQQLSRFLDFDPGNQRAAQMRNNMDWFRDLDFLSFIRDVGKHISVSYMMAKESVQKRLETGISFTEFSYQLIQAYDFWHLYTREGVTLQMGGADQWGNMLTGVELIRRKSAGAAQAFTTPLLTRSDGGKFGKTEEGTIWLDKELTSPYRFYQYWMQLADQDAEAFFPMFSLKPMEEIQEMMDAHRQAPHRRELQKALAREMTILVHGKEEWELAVKATEILFGKATLEALQSLPGSRFLELMEGVPRVEARRADLDQPMDLVDFLVQHQVFSSKGEVRKLIQQGGLRLNKEKVTEPGMKLGPEALVSQRFLLIQKGKSHYTLAVFE